MLANERELKIKTGVLKRTAQEYLMYQKEAQVQKSRIDKLIESNACVHQIKKQVFYY